jgi:nitrogen regulatory protein PII 2
MSIKNQFKMKMIIAIIRIDRMNETKKALNDVDLPSFTATGKVFGRGKGRWEAKVLEGVKEEQPEALALLNEQPRLRPQRLITIVVPDSKVKTTVSTIIKANQSKNAGDGKIFVLPMSEAISIRTGETGNAVLD